DELPDDTSARLHVSMPDMPESIDKEITLSRTAGNNFEYHSSEFSLNGSWDILIGMTEPDTSEVTQTLTHTFAETRSAPGAAADPWRFHSWGGGSALIILLVGIVAAVLSVFASRAPFRKEAGGLGAATLALGLVILVQARVDPILA